MGGHPSRQTGILASCNLKNIHSRVCQRLGIKTTVLEEKLTAVEMLFCFAKELGPSFAEYAVPVLDLVRIELN